MRHDLLFSPEFSQIKREQEMQEGADTFKIVVIGSSGVGKTNISTKYISDSFNSICQPTLGVQFMTKVLEVNGRSIKICLWDTAGQERYRALSKVYYKGASGAIVVYDLTDAKSYLDVENWMRLLNENLNLEDVVLALVGNKTDLSDRREVPSERPVQEYKEAFDIDCWEVSALTGQNIEELFADVIKKMVWKANDTKSTMYRGTIQYESERGTLVPVKQEGPLGMNHMSSIIIEQEEDDRSNHEGHKRQEELVNANYRFTLSPEDGKRIKFPADENKRKKCCLTS